MENEPADYLNHEAYTPAQTDLILKLGDVDKRRREVDAVRVDFERTEPATVTGLYRDGLLEFEGLGQLPSLSPDGWDIYNELDQQRPEQARPPIIQPAAPSYDRTAPHRFFTKGPDRGRDRGR